MSSLDQSGEGEKRHRPKEERTSKPYQQSWEHLKQIIQFTLISSRMHMAITMRIPNRTGHVLKLILAMTGI